MVGDWLAGRMAGLGPGVYHRPNTTMEVWKEGQVHAESGMDVLSLPK